MNQLVLLPVILPLLGAGLSLAFRRWAFAQRVISVTALALVVVVAASLLFHVDRNEPLAVTVGGWPAELGISLVADRLSALLLLTSTIVTRSEEHTSELQSRFDLVCRLLLVKKIDC